MVFSLSRIQSSTFAATAGKSLLGAGCALVLFCTVASAAEEVNLPVAAETSTSSTSQGGNREASDSFFAPAAELVQEKTTATIFALSNRIDAFFVDRKVDETFNRTRLRLRLGEKYTEGGEYALVQAVRLNLDLPGSREKIGLFFDRERNEEESQTTGSIFNDGDEEVKFSLRAGLRYTIDKGPWHHLQFQLGTRYLPEIRPFSEFRGGLALPLGRWLFQPTQILFWRDEIGFGETTRLDFDYPLSERSRLRLRNEGTFSESSAGYEYLLTTSYAHQLSPRRGFELALQMSGRTRPDADVVNYGAICTWRQRIHEDWLFVELIPRIDFPEEKNFRATTAVSLIFEANFGNWNR